MIHHPKSNTCHPAIGMERLLELFVFEKKQKRLATARPVAIVEGIAMKKHKKTPTDAGVLIIYID